MFEKTDILESPPASLPSAANSDVATSPTPQPLSAGDQETLPDINITTTAAPETLNIKTLQTEHLTSFKRKPFTPAATMNLYQKRLRKKARLQKIIKLNKKFKYNNSLSSSSSFSSLSSNSSSFSQISEDLNTAKRTKTDPPMKLHKFYHSVPFQCPFCFTFKDSDTDFVDHLATAHHSDVKLLYEKKCLTIIENLNKRKLESSAESLISQEKIECKTEKMSDTEINKVPTADSMQATENVNVSSKALYTSSTLPPRKQQRLLKSPVNDAPEMVQSYPQIQQQQQQLQKQQQSLIKSESYLNYYFDNNKPSIRYPASQQQSQTGFIMPNSNDTTFQSDNGKNLMLAAAAAASMLNQPPKNYHQHHNNSNSSNLVKNYSVLSAASEASMKCAICDRGFEYYSNLRRHIKTKHKIFGKQVKEYVIRYQYNSNNSSNNSCKGNNNTSLENLAVKHHTDENFPLTSPGSNATSSLKNSDSSTNNASSIMMMSPQSGGSSQQSNNTASTNYMDLGLINNKSSSNGKNSPLSSMSSSSMCSIKSLTKSNKSSPGQHKPVKTEESYEADMDQRVDEHVSPNGLFPGFSLNGKVSAMQGIGAGNANIAAMAAAVAGMSGNGNMLDLK